jgi:hypothetical protein
LGLNAHSFIKQREEFAFIMIRQIYERTGLTPSSRALLEWKYSNRLERQKKSMQLRKVSIYSQKKESHKSIILGESLDLKYIDH